jgi:hypothetical protein
MEPNLLDRIFEIQRKIDGVVRSKYEGVDQGMFVPQQDSKEYWRDNSYWNDEETTYSFTFSTKGNYTGDLPPDCSLDIMMILESYRD